MSSNDLEARIDLLERALLELQSRMGLTERNTVAAVDQAKYAVRKLDQLRAALHDTPAALPVPPGVR